MGIAGRRFNISLGWEFLPPRESPPHLWVAFMNVCYWQPARFMKERSRRALSPPLVDRPPLSAAAFVGLVSRLAGFDGSSDPRYAVGFCGMTGSRMKAPRPGPV